MKITECKRERRGSCLSYKEECPKEPKEGEACPFFRNVEPARMQIQHDMEIRRRADIWRLLWG